MIATREAKKSSVIFVLVDCAHFLEEVERPILALNERTRQKESEISVTRKVSLPNKGITFSIIGKACIDFKGDKQSWRDRGVSRIDREKEKRIRLLWNRNWIENQFNPFHHSSF